MKAFTLLELLIAMSIIAILGTVGFQAMIAYRDTITFQQAESFFVSNIQTTINLARNSVKYGGQLYDAYALEFRDDNLNRYVCNEVETFGFGGSYDCQIIERNLKPESFQDVKIELSNVNECSIILFKRLDSDIVALDSASLPYRESDIDTCVIQLVGLSNTNSTIEINLLNNNIDL